MLAPVSVLGKRKASTLKSKDYILHLNSSSEPQTGLSESEYEPAASSSKPVLINGSLVEGSTKKRYQCTVEGCGKAYSKPSRLEEHSRSHTGIRPYTCDTCQKSYFRENHLQAHARTHLPASERPFVCSLPDCEKRFWTQQHLRAHTEWHEGAKTFPCPESNCNEVFAKHHQLRSHICSVHSPPGSKPYPCSHEGCTKSFDTNQHLRTHLKVHNDKRYTCVHEACLPTVERRIVFYPTWTALQHHTRTVHPPACTHSSCKGRVFASQKSLRAHQKLHEQRDEEAQLNFTIAGSDGEDEPSAKKRRGGELGRDWKCDEEGCGKDFKSSKALGVHHKVVHLGRRDFKCTREECGATFGYKHLLQRHVARLHCRNSDKDEGLQHAAQSSESAASESELESEAAVSKPLMGIGAITGESYSNRAQELLGNSKAFRCPHPNLPFAVCSEGGVPDGSVDVAEQAPSDVQCDHIYRRAYDLRRHLRAVHNIEVEKEVADLWVRKMKSVA
ncbi:transcription factor iiia [Lentinula raphanica]|nr:transcription factor iiia [Lentinula raphanica]